MAHQQSCRFRIYGRKDRGIDNNLSFTYINMCYLRRQVILVLLHFGDRLKKKLNRPVKTIKDL